MAFRSIGLKLPDLPSLRVAGKAARRSARDTLHEFLSKDSATQIWQLLSMPYWIWSDVPPLPLPSRPKTFPDGGPIGHYVINEITRIRHRIWLSRMASIIARSGVLVLLIAVIWQAWELVGGSGPNIGAMVAIAVPILLFGLVIGLASCPGVDQVGRMLDRSFSLHERVTTAIANIGVDVFDGVGQPSIVYRQVADAANAISVNRNDSAFRLKLPIREFALAIIFALTFASLFLLRGGNGSIPPVQESVVPVFVPAAESYVKEEQPLAEQQDADVPANAEDIEQWIDDANEARQDLQALGDALDDHPLTHQIANQIQQGDYAGAAQGLRDVASDASQMSESDRQNLAADLEAATSNMSADSTLADASQDAADSLKQGGAEAEEGMSSLGDAVDETASRIASPENLEQSQQSATSSSQTGPQEGSTSEAQSPAAQQSLFGSESPGQSGSSSDQQNTSSGGPNGTDASSGLSDTESQTEESNNATSGETTGGDSGQQSGSGNSSDQGAAPGQSGQAGDQGGSSDTSATEGEGDIASQGSGAGGSSQPDDSGEPGTGGGQASQQQPDEDKLPPEPEVSDADGADGGGDEADADPRQAVSLSRNQNGDLVQLPGSSGVSSVGSGAGVTISGGSATQGEVEAAGPDSNHVPQEYRNVVESYFSDSLDE